MGHISWNRRDFLLNYQIYGHIQSAKILKFLLKCSNLGENIYNKSFLWFERSPRASSSSVDSTHMKFLKNESAPFTNFIQKFFLVLNVSLILLQLLKRSTVGKQRWYKNRWFCDILISELNSNPIWKMFCEPFPLVCEVCLKLIILKK